MDGGIKFLQQLIDCAINEFGLVEQNEMKSNNQLLRPCFLSCVQPVLLLRRSDPKRTIIYNMLRYSWCGWYCPYRNIPLNWYADPIRSDMVQFNINTPVIFNSEFGFEGGAESS